MAERRILVTGGAGFIGSAVCRQLVRSGHHVVNVDKLTYSGTLASLASIAECQNYRFYKVDICDREGVSSILATEAIDAVIHLAAESHVDRSIDAPAVFVETNVVGTYRLLSAAFDYWQGLGPAQQAGFRFHHVSTDEVFGDLPWDAGEFSEETPYSPSSPYSASKAASDHLVRAWHHTYGLPILVSNCSNNYGPYHFPEKLIPLVILNALEGKPLPIYGKGKNIRDWLYVEDHARALEAILLQGRVGESYNVGARAERNNLEVVEAICDVLDRRKPMRGGSYRDLIRFVPDRPGHDRRYAINPAKVERQLGWRALESFESGIEKTIDWFLANEAWWRPIREGTYGGERLGLST